MLCLTPYRVLVLSIKHSAMEANYICQGSGAMARLPCLHEQVHGDGKKNHPTHTRTRTRTRTHATPSRNVSKGPTRRNQRNKARQVPFGTTQCQTNGPMILAFAKTSKPHTTPENPWPDLRTAHRRSHCLLRAESSQLRKGRVHHTCVGGQKKKK